MPDCRLTPFIVAGLGGVRYSPKISNHDMSIFDLGVGAKYWMADHFAFRLDLRDNLVTEVFPFRKSYHNIQASAGIVFAFGGKSKSAPTSGRESLNRKLRRRPLSSCLKRPNRRLRKKSRSLRPSRRSLSLRLRTCISISISRPLRKKRRQY